MSRALDSGDNEVVYIDCEKTPPRKLRRTSNAVASPEAICIETPPPPLDQTVSNRRGHGINASLQQQHRLPVAGAHHQNPAVPRAAAGSGEASGDHSTGILAFGQVKGFSKGAQALGIAAMNSLLNAKR